MRKGIHTKLGYLGIEVADRKLPWVGVSFEIGDYEGDEITLGIYLYFTAIWFHYGSGGVYKLCKQIGKLHGAKYTRSYNSHIHIGEAFSLKIFGDHVGDNALYRKYIDIPDLLKGRPKCSVEILQQGETEVVMPEKAYPATFTIERRTWTYPRWFKRTRTDIEITVLEKGGIPHEGKGENSWDCGMDGTISRHSTYKDSVREATESFAIGVLRERQRHSRLDKYLEYGVKPLENTGLVHSDATA